MVPSHHGAHAHPFQGLVLLAGRGPQPAHSTGHPPVCVAPWRCSCFCPDRGGRLGGWGHSLGLGTHTIHTTTPWAPGPPRCTLGMPYLGGVFVCPFAGVLGTHNVCTAGEHSSKCGCICGDTGPRRCSGPCTLCPMPPYIGFLLQLWLWPGHGCAHSGLWVLRTGTGPSQPPPEVTSSWHGVPSLPYVRLEGGFVSPPPPPEIFWGCLPCAGVCYSGGGGNVLWEVGCRGSC